MCSDCERASDARCSLQTCNAASVRGLGPGVMRFSHSLALLVSISAADLRSKQIQGEGKPRSSGGRAGFGHALIVDPVRGCSVIFLHWQEQEDDSLRMGND